MHFDLQTHTNFNIPISPNETRFMWSEDSWDLTTVKNRIYHLNKDYNEGLRPEQSIIIQKNCVDTTYLYIIIFILVFIIFLFLLLSIIRNVFLLNVSSQPQSSIKKNKQLNDFSIDTEAIETYMNDHKNAIDQLYVDINEIKANRAKNNFI